MAQDLRELLKEGIFVANRLRFVSIGLRFFEEPGLISIKCMGGQEHDCRRSRLGLEMPADGQAIHGDTGQLGIGTEADIDDHDLKQAYRRMATQNHPDRLMARGAPAEILRIADEKMASINTAYERILEERGLSVGVGN